MRFKGYDDEISIMRSYGLHDLVPTIYPCPDIKNHRSTGTKPSLTQQNTTSQTATPKRTQRLGNSQSSSTVQKPTGINKNAYQLDPTQKKPTGVTNAPQGANFETL